MKIAIMGSGGLGGYYGARLQAGGNDVTFVARGKAIVRDNTDPRANITSLWRRMRSD